MPADRPDQGDKGREHAPERSGCDDSKQVADRAATAPGSRADESKKGESKKDQSKKDEYTKMAKQVGDGIQVLGALATLYSL
jgi:hypothetical protein